MGFAIRTLRRVKEFPGQFLYIVNMLRRGLSPTFYVPLMILTSAFVGSFIFSYLFLLIVIPAVVMFLAVGGLSLLSTSGSGNFDAVDLVILAVAGLLYLITLAVTVFVPLLVFVYGIMFCYSAAAKFHQFCRWLRRRYLRRVVTREHVTAPVLPGPPATASAGGEGGENPLAHYHRIGIILAGGGAKGAYQAGAMKAIYEFLEEHGAHDKVCMIAATSIGSWNALFWLAGLVKERADGISPLEAWWSGVNVHDIVLPVPYAFGLRNHFLSNQPWRESFNELFLRTPAGEQLRHHLRNPSAPDAIHFYFTRSNIGKANLAFVTNRASWDDVTFNQRLRHPRSDYGEYARARKLADVRRGVFSSMDIPPLFPYMTDRKKSNFFEDGGVVDNLPIRFGTEVENCDLLFILPLNASFDSEVHTRSVLRRLARVNDVRQGVLERNSFKMIYLFNELAGLRHKLDEEREAAKRLRRQLQEPGAGAPAAAPEAGPKPLSEKKVTARAHKRSHNIVRVFSLCPGPDLFIHTTEFWKTEDAARAFRFMYHAARHELREKFKYLVESDLVRMAIVGTVGANGGQPPSAALNWHKVTTPEISYQVEYFENF